jgi:hypothetical protein
MKRYAPGIKFYKYWYRSSSSTGNIQIRNSLYQRDAIVTFSKASLFFSLYEATDLQLIFGPT